MNVYFVKFINQVYYEYLMKNNAFLQTLFFYLRKGDLYTFRHISNSH